MILFAIQRYSILLDARRFAKNKSKYGISRGVHFGVHTILFRVDLYFNLCNYRIHLIICLSNLSLGTQVV